MIYINYQSYGTSGFSLRLRFYQDGETKFLRELQPLVTPALGCGSSYSWNGGHCPNEQQRKFIAQTYYLYREMRHRLTTA